MLFASLSGQLNNGKKNIHRKTLKVRLTTKRLKPRAWIVWGYCVTLNRKAFKSIGDLIPPPLFFAHIFCTLFTKWNWQFVSMLNQTVSYFIKPRWIGSINTGSVWFLISNTQFESNQTRHKPRTLTQKLKRFYFPPCFICPNPGIFFSEWHILGGKKKSHYCLKL